MNELRIKPDKDSLAQYIINFEKGNLQVPAFQRDFVWTNEKKLELFDSIRKGYPIGSILLWKPKFDTEEDYENFGAESLGEYKTPKRTSDSFYILDGFQRLSTLIGCLLHPEKAKQKGISRNEEEWFKKFNIIYNLKDEVFEISRTKKFAKLDFFQIPVYQLIDGKAFFKFQRQITLFENDDNIAELYIQKYEEMSLLFQKYEIPSINILGGTISEAIDIFQRLNSTGAPITSDWVVSARAFGKDMSFRLGTEIDNLLEIELSKYNFQNIKREVILNCITNSFGGVYFDQISKNDYRRLEKLVDREDFIPVTKDTFSAIITASNFLFQNLYTLNNKFLPYNNQLIFLTDFFNKVEKPTPTQLETLKRWFWITTYANYFTIYNLSKQRLAYKEFQSFIQNEHHNPIYYDRKDERFETLEFPTKIEMGSVRAKALGLFMLYHQAEGKQLDVHLVDGYKEYRLFLECKNPKSSENTILIIDDGKYPIDKFQKDLSHWLEETENYEPFFITSAMQNAYKNGENKEYILAMRKELMIAAEKEFVESFKLIYIEE